MHYVWVMVSENEKLDAVLIYLNNVSEEHGKVYILKDVFGNIVGSQVGWSPDGRDYKSLSDISQGILFGELNIEHITYLDLMLKHLNEVEQFIDVIETAGVKKYGVLFKGKLFISNGGYQHRYIQEMLQEKRVRNTQLLTWILSLGVLTPSVWYFLEIMKFHLKYVFEISTFLFVLVSGITIGIIGCLTLSILMRRKK